MAPDQQAAWGSSPGSCQPQADLSSKSGRNMPQASQLRETVGEEYMCVRNIVRVAPMPWLAALVACSLFAPNFWVEPAQTVLTTKVSIPISVALFHSFVWLEEYNGSFYNHPYKANTILCSGLRKFSFASSIVHFQK